MNTSVISRSVGLVLLLGGAVGDAHAGTVKFTPCGSGSTMTLKSLDQRPSPPSIKSPITESWQFSNSAAITSGATMHETWKVGSTVVRDSRVDLCEQFMKAGTACPIQPGSSSFPYQYSAPTSTPPFVNIAVHRVLKNGDGSALLCYDFTLKLNP